MATAGATEGKGAGQRSASPHVFALFGLFAVEMLLFCMASRRHYAWIYPRWFDQAQYLSDAYSAYGTAHASGFAAGVGAAVGHQSPQGALHALLALLVFEVAGPSRVAALSVGLLGLAALQLATFAAMRRLSGSPALAWAAVALVAALNSPWSGGAGSASDFRLDWIAACAYGSALAVGLLGRGFRSTGWAALFGVAVGLALLVRFLTVIYFGGIFVILFAWLALGPDRTRRLGRLVLSALVAGSISGWAFWRSRHIIYHYYWTGHYMSPEGALRDAHMGPLGSLGWLLRVLVDRHVGLGASAVGIAALVLFLLARRHTPAPSRARWDFPAGLGDACVLTAAFLAAPSLLLLSHPEKAEPPVAILAPAAIWLLFLGWWALSASLTGRQVKGISSWIAVISGALFLAYQLRDATPASQVPGFRTVNSVSDFIFYRSEEAGLSRPRVDVTWTCDSLYGESMRLLGYERHGKMIPFISVLPATIVEESRSAVFGELKESDFVFVVTRAQARWPFDRQMEALRPEVLEWCAANMVHDGEVETQEFAASIYERRGLNRPEGALGLQATLDRGLALKDFEVPPPPAKPAIWSLAPVLWSTSVPLHYVVKAAYSPLELRAVEMPAGVGLDEGRGLIEGRFPKAGAFVARLAATNAAGTTTAGIRFQVGDAAWDVRLAPPEKARPGEPVALCYSAFDSGGHLDFIDITDVSESRVLARLLPSDDEKVAWQGAYSLVLAEPGRHRIIARTVRYDPTADAYSFLDRECVVEVAP